MVMHDVAVRLLLRSLGAEESSFSHRRTEAQMAQSSPPAALLYTSTLGFNYYKKRELPDAGHARRTSVRLCFLCICERLKTHA